MPERIDFINIESFYFYMFLGFPDKGRELTTLMGIIDPYIPMIISPQNLEEVVSAYEEGDTSHLANLEENFMGRSKFIFMNSVMMAQGADWDNIVAICLRIREVKSQQTTFA